MATSPELAALREEIADLHRRAGKKVSRLRAKGVETAAIDPRRQLSVATQRYNTRQALAYKARLEKFLSRRTQWDAGFNGAPLSRESVRAFRRAQSIRNKAVQRRFDMVKHLVVPDMNVSIYERSRILMSTFGKVGDELDPTHMKAIKLRRFKDEKALKKMTSQMLREADVVNYRANLAKKSLPSMFSHMPDILKEIRSLTPEQLDVLWTHTTFTDMAKLIYSIEQNGDGTGRLGRTNITSDSLNRQAHDLIKWVKGV